MPAGSWIVAISRRRPPQCPHASTSIASARCISAAQLPDRSRLCALPWSGASTGAVACGLSARRRPYATTSCRHRAWGANRPWPMSRFVSDRGVIAANRSRNSTGSNSSSRVPSCHACFKSRATRPSTRRRRRACANGGRSTDRHRRSSPARSWAASLAPRPRLSGVRFGGRSPREGLQRLPVVRALAERDVQPRAAERAEAVERSRHFLAVGEQRMPIEIMHALAQTEPAAEQGQFGSRPARLRCVGRSRR